MHSRLMMVRFLYLLECHFRDEHQPMFYASAMNMTLFQINNLTRKELGKRVYECIQDRIHNEALHLLLHSSLKVSEIAYTIGCYDHGHFTRSFKKREGVSPVQYKRSLAALGMTSGSCATSR
ncbi:AraC family transcriptional regulator [Pedobacter sp. JY14-1]|uniref:helix-turn-helix domain-containing protein n=1 Tax=Pedobacter sp. JY14-1 TaxID=3034151 RepID=UPI0023E2C95F|nr:AraC family transcriptional regulator [Pedobacter sp. JY14-1]